ncbi:hypothetical protein FACS1894109_19630 [Spirochaetia bacterium]|nr:hypothetical protein FACS1894109_19630 [Spirochaetia bacterium]
MNHKNRFNFPGFPADAIPLSAMYGAGLPPVKISAADMEALSKLPRATHELLGEIATEAALIRIMNYLKETGRKTITEEEAGRFHDECLKMVIDTQLRSVDVECVVAQEGGKVIPFSKGGKK